MLNQTGVPPTAGERNPLHHTQKIRQSLKEIATHMREDIDKVEEPQAKAMFETSAEVIEGIITAFEHYEAKSENAWRV